MKSKRCIVCLETKLVSEFPSNGGGHYKARCRPCYNFHQAQYRNKPENKDRIQRSWKEASSKYYSTEKRRNKTLRGYGLDESDYNEMYEAQDGTCKICNQDLRLVVDHCHESGKVRGLLCNQCNIGLGAFYDNIERLQVAINYLNDAV